LTLGRGNCDATVCTTIVGTIGFTWKASSRNGVSASGSPATALNDAWRSVDSPKRRAKSVAEKSTVGGANALVNDAEATAGQSAKVSTAICIAQSHRRMIPPSAAADPPFYRR